MAEYEFDVFLSHNGRDKPLVRELKQLLCKAGLKVWLDEGELQPGVAWQPLLEAGVRASQSIAVLIGSDGLGPWEDQEMQGALRLAARDERPVIPTLLPECPKQPEIPMFLGNRTWVDLRDGYTDVAIKKLIWGITGQRPNQLQVTSRLPPPTAAADAIPSNAGRQKAGAARHDRAPGESKPKAPGRKYFAAASLSMLLTAGLYPLALWYQFEPGTAWYYFKHNPNYSVFVLGILPLAVALFVSVAARIFQRGVPIFWGVLLTVGGVPILLSVILHDALDKGPPIQPTHLVMTATQQQAILTLEKNIRSTYFEDGNRDTGEMLREYVLGAARIMAVNESEIEKFSDFKDFFRRASVVAYVDLFISMIAAAFVIVVLWTLAFVSSQRPALKTRYGEALSWIFSLLVLL